MSDVLTQLERAWQRSDAVFDLLVDDAALYERPIALRHPFIFYLGHLAAFAWNQVGAGVLGLGPVDADWDLLFERGIDPLDAAEAEAVSIASWPDADGVRQYRDAVRQRILDVLPALDASEDPLAERRRILHVVLEHEAMHHETLMYIFQRLPFAQKKAGPTAGLLDVVGEPSNTHAAHAALERRAIPGGLVRVGAEFDEQDFGWCNEFPAQRVEVAPFGLDSLPVTVGRFEAFVQDGGYARPELWSETGWAWIQGCGRTRPIDQEEEGDGRILLRRMFDRLPLQAAWELPVHVSHAEAEAYCRWRGARLPTEAELQHAAYGTPDGGEVPQVGDGGGNFGWRTVGAEPVGSRPGSASAFGVHELVGNGWEWTRTPFRPLPGFTPWIRTYPGYSADFFDDKHYVVFGASWATDRALVRRSFRNWYQGCYPHVFSTFRCATDG